MTKASGQATSPGGACGAGLGCEATYLALGGGFEDDPVAHCGGLGDVVAQSAFGGDAVGVVVGAEVAEACGRVGQQVVGSPEGVAPSGSHRSVPEPPDISPDARRRQVTTLINAAALARQEPAVYVIEGAHWIDEVSESMLADFLAVVPQTPSLVPITYRPEYHGALTRLSGAQTMALRPLNCGGT